MDFDFVRERDAEFLRPGFTYLMKRDRFYGPFLCKGETGNVCKMHGTESVQFVRMRK